MPLSAGTRIGPYIIDAPLGAGGMGEVYRARDDKLNRDVAIKILPPGFASDPDRLARFEREARMLASLNHPNIGTIYCVEGTDDARALVLELVEGATLAERLVAGPLPLTETLPIARQIADALDAAHERGIVHRDLKPANVKITPDGVVKVLDFGLAKSWADDVAGPDPVSSPTVTSGATRDGVVLGTPAYMSPEQARGKPVDRRTDVWAFGCLLYEMLTGRLAFRGETIADTTAAILEHEPDWRALPATTPPSVRRLLRRCLEKDAKQRLRDIGDVRLDLDEAFARRAPVEPDLEHQEAVASAAPQHDGTSGALAASRSVGVFPRRLRFGLGLGATVAAVFGVGAWLWFGSTRTAAPRPSSYVQITNFPDSATQPALSPDGRMLTFIRGAGTFFTPGQIYVKLLPDGEPEQLTHDDLRKMSPVFSPDGSRIAYTTFEPGQVWNTWTVPVLGGAPRLWLPNASGLVWTGPQRLLFSEIKSGMHMGLVAAAESRAEARDIYIPAHMRGMAHRSYLSPDGQWVMLAEMDGTGAWAPCRVVRFDLSSTGRQIGPPAAACTSAAWSRDGQWIYLSAFADGNWHIWRERFPTGRPEQVTFGPTAEEGIAMAADGRSFITSVGLKQRTVSIHDARGDRQISAEGYAYQPSFSPDGRRLYYRILTGGGQIPFLEKSELWVADLDSGRSELLLPGFSVTGYDISPDGLRVAFAALGADGRTHLWLAATDHRSPPRAVPGAEGVMNPRFGPPGELVFVAADGNHNFAFRTREDGSEKQRMTPEEVDGIQAISPDQRWLVGYSPVSGPDHGSMSAVAYPIAGGEPVRIYNLNWQARWSRDMKRFYLQVLGPDSGGSGNTYVLPVTPSHSLPDVPPGGFHSEEELAAVPGVRVIKYADVDPGLTDDTYAFSVGTTQRNLYRIPIR